MIHLRLHGPERQHDRRDLAVEVVGVVRRYPMLQGLGLAGDSICQVRRGQFPGNSGGLVAQALEQLIEL